MILVPRGGKKVISQQVRKDISQYHNVNNINQMRLILSTCLIHKGPVSLKWTFWTSTSPSGMDGCLPKNCFPPLHCPLARKLHLWDFQVQINWTVQMVRMPNPYQVDYSVNGYPILCRTRILGWNSSMNCGHVPIKNGPTICTTRIEWHDACTNSLREISKVLGFSKSSTRKAFSFDCSVDQPMQH